jgi:hypothetical protein
MNSFNVPATINPQTARLPQTYMLLNSKGAVKIGFSTDLIARRASLEASSGERLSVIRTFSGGRATERWLHKRYADHRTVGEWFTFCPSMMQVIPPDEIPVRPKKVIRRDVRLTCKERVKATTERARDIGITGTARLTLIAQALNDEEANAAVEMILAGLSLPTSEPA